MSHTAGAFTVAVLGRAFKDSEGFLHAALHRVVCSGVASCSSASTVHVQWTGSGGSPRANVSRPLNADCLDFTSAETVPTCWADDGVFVHFNLQRLETCPSRSTRHVGFCFLACYLSVRTNTTLTSIKADLNFSTLKANPFVKKQIFLRGAKA